MEQLRHITVLVTIIGNFLEGIKLAKRVKDLIAAPQANKLGAFVSVILGFIFYVCPILNYVVFSTPAMLVPTKSSAPELYKRLAEEKRLKESAELSRRESEKEQLQVAEQVRRLKEEKCLLEQQAQSAENERRLTEERQKREYAAKTEELNRITQAAEDAEKRAEEARKEKEKSLAKELATKFVLATATPPKDANYGVEVGKTAQVSPASPSYGRSERLAKESSARSAYAQRQGERSAKQEANKQAYAQRQEQKNTALAAWNANKADLASRNIRTWDLPQGRW